MCCDPVATPTNRRHFPKVPVPWHPGPEVGRPKIRVRSTIGDLVTVRPQCEGTELQSQPGPVPHDVPAEGHIGTPPPTPAPPRPRQCVARGTRPGCAADRP